MFGRKKVPKEETKPKSRKGDALMAQLGLTDDLSAMEHMIYGDDDDDDLEAELAALQSDSSPENVPQPKKKEPFNIAAIEKFAQEVGNDNDDDEIGEEEESGLMAELQALTDDSPTRSSPASKNVNAKIADISVIVEDRLGSYQLALKNAQANKDDNKVKRLSRGVKTLQDNLADIKAGKLVDPESIPPPVAVGSVQSSVPESSNKVQQISAVAAVNTSSTEPTLPVNQPRAPAVKDRPSQPSKPIPAVPSSKPLIELSKPPSNDPNYVPGSEFVEEKDKKTHALLYNRRAEYKKAALAAKHSGDMKTATDLVRTAKQFDAVILALEEGKPVDLSKMPPPPSEVAPRAPSLNNAISKKITEDVVSRKTMEKHQGSSVEKSVASENHEEEKKLFSAPSAPKSILEALNQRINKYRSAEDDAKKEGNGSKARRMGRIVKQYDEAIKLHKAGKPVDFESLPTPPGFDPIPLGESSQPSTAPPSVKTAEQVGAPTLRVEAKSPIPADGRAQNVITAPQSPPFTQPPKPSTQPSASQPPTPASQSPVSASANQIQADEKQKQAPAQSKRSPSVRQEQHLTFLKTRMREFKEAALAAKRNNDIELAKKYFRYAKGCEPMIDAAESGLPVDLSQVPEAPNTGTNAEFVVVTEGESDITGDRTEMFKKLEETLLHQIKMCTSNIQQYTALGDVPMASKFKSFEKNTRKDLDSLKSAFKHGAPVPKFHHELRTFSMVRCNADLGETDMELNILKGIQYNPPSGVSKEDLTTYVKYEFPFPADESQAAETRNSRPSCNPEYNETFRLEINKKSRAFARVIERKGLKLEVMYKRGFLKSDKVLGTVNVNLQPLETSCLLHDSYNLMDGRKAVGGKLELKIRIRDPLKNRQVEEVKEKWLVIDTFFQTPESKASSEPATLNVNKNHSEMRSIEVMRFEKRHLDKQISYLKGNLNSSQLQTLHNKSKLIQDAVESQQKVLQEGGLPTIKVYAERVQSEIQLLDHESRNVMKQGDMQKAENLVAKKKAAENELKAINAKLKIME